MTTPSISILFRGGLLAAVVLLGSSLRAQCAPDFNGSPITPAGPQPRTLVVANLNGDAYPDLVVGSWDRDGGPAAGMAVLLGQSEGRFAPVQELLPGQEVFDLTAGDFDGDGDDDIAFTSNGVLRVLRTDGGALRETAVSFPSPAPLDKAARAYVESGDFNGDGLADLAFLRYLFYFSSPLPPSQILLSKGGLTFEGRDLPQTQITSPAAADLDGDGRDELITGGGGQIRIYPGNATPGAGEPLTFGSHHVFVVTGDFDGDHRLDILGFDPRSTKGIGVIYDPYSPGAATTWQREVPVGDDEPAVADFNGDGIDDLAVHPWSGALRLLYGTATRKFVPGGIVLLTPQRDFYSSPAHFGAADFDADGDVDVVATADTGVAFYANRGDGTLAGLQYRSPALAVADFNGDGRDDGFTPAGTLVTTLAEGVVPSPEELSGDYYGAAVGDVNSDGKLDVIAALGGKANDYKTRLDCFLGNGDGTLQPPVIVLMLGRLNESSPPLLADFNGDRNPDILLVGERTEAVTIQFGRGDGSFTPMVHYPVRVAHQPLATGDFNGDGRIDLAQGSWVLFNDGGGSTTTFKPLVRIAENSVDTVAIADFNRDGRDDLLLTSYSGVTLYLGQADETFEPRKLSSVVGVADTLIGDFSGEGMLDVVIHENNWFSYFEGDGSGRFGPGRRQWQTSDGKVSVGDFDGDGRHDLLDGGFLRLTRCDVFRRRAVR